MKLISDSTLIQASLDQVSTEVNDEAVILNLKDGVYYGLNPLGARIWRLVQEPISFQEIIHLLLDEYQVEPQVCRREVIALFEKLSTWGLIQISQEAGA